MFFNYFKIAIRNLWKNKAFSLINIVGLAIGMAACFLIFLYVQFEFSYDSFHENADRIYRLSIDVKTTDQILHSDKSSAPMAPILKDEFPEIENFVRICPHSILVRSGDKKFQEENTLFADSTFFSVFNFPLLKGNEKTALAGLLNVVFTESSAKKYFGLENPIGKSLLLGGGGHHAIVTGIIKDFPENSHIKAGMLLSSQTKEKFSPGIMKNFYQNSWFTYLLLKEGSNPVSLQNKFAKYVEARYGKEMLADKYYTSLVLEPIKDIYLHSERKSAESYRFSHGDLSSINIFSSTALFILLIACFNFINLSTSRASERAKEVGIRKVTGAQRKELIFQFLGESVLTSLLAGLLSICFCVLALPIFNQLSGKVICANIFEYANYLPLLLLVVISIGLLAGIYPALVLSGFNPITVLKGKFISGTKGIFLRKALVISQFTISISLIIATIIVFRQLDYMRNKDLGFKKNQMMVLDYHYEDNGQVLAENIKKLPNILSTSVSWNIPGYNFYKNQSEIKIEHVSGKMEPYIMDLYSVDYAFLKQFEIPLSVGRNFSAEFRTDTAQAMILNEVAVKKLGYNTNQEIIGKRFYHAGQEGKVIGVVKNFHDQSPKDEIQPLAIKLLSNQGTFISLNVTTKDLSATIASVKDEWEKTIGHRPFEYFFVDETFNKQYRSEEQFGKLFFYFSILAIAISSLGLIGLVTFSTLQRTKEIGIRKVLGSSVFGIVNLLSKEFLKLVATAFIIASIASWFTMNKWLQDYAYKTDIVWWIFAVAGILAFIIALFSVGYQAIKAAIANPIKSLRTE
jgi:putative ABC transport system permease protein